MDKNPKNSSAKNSDQLEGYNPKQFILIKIIYSILSVLNIIVVVASFARVGFALNDARIATECIGTMNTRIVSANADLYSIVFDLTNDNLSDTEKASRIKSSQTDITAIFTEINDIKTEFDSIERMNDEAEEKFEEAWASIEEYRNQLGGFDTALNSSDLKDTAGKIHDEFNNILPVMDKTTALIDEAAAIQKDASYKMFVSTARSVLWIILMLLIIFVVGIVTIVLMQRSAKKTALELKKKNEELEAFSQKLFSSREKTQVNSHITPLTGLKNRYAMDEDLQNRLKRENFCIANFNFDHLRDLNENFGRDFGDKLLVTVAEMLKNDYSKYAEVYNITFDEFCVVFNSNVSESQAKNLVDEIAKKMSSAYTIFNISVQLNVSGCMYYYQSKDYLELNSLFMMLDKTLHTVKDEGGNKILKVNN
ncbi:MAG: GGDEF domain-containing protein [Ruminococcus flavefaciens]|nr:GGDEF domain-containing protein [Ruminococcus flavefaciens]MCM1230593.1 GGDEF domain-containing protein [Ruminococcus flavefaciens]